MVALTHRLRSAILSLALMLCLTLIALPGGVHADPALLGAGPQVWTDYSNLDEADCLVVQGDYVWAGGVGGLVRWDSRTGTYRHFTTRDGLPDNRVSSLDVDDAGRLWIATAAGLAVYDGAVWRTYTAADGLPDTTVHVVAVDGQNRPWVGSLNGLAVLDGETWRVYTEADGLPMSSVFAVEHAPDGGVWVATLGISHFDGQTWHSWTIDDGLATNYCQQIGVDPQGRVWAACSQGLNVYDGTQWRLYTQSDGLPSNWVSSVAFSADGNVWAGTSGNGLAMWDGSTWQPWNSRRCDGLASDYVSDLAIDAQGRLWVATSTDWVDGGSGLSMFDGERWRTYAVEPELSSNDIWGISFDQLGSAWFATRNGVSVVDSQGKWRRYGEADGLAEYQVTAVAVDHLDRKWFGSANRGISMLDGDTWHSYTMEDGLADTHYSVIAEDSTGRIWAGSGQWGAGLNVYDGHAWQTYTDADGLGSNGVMNIVPDTAGRVWVTTWGAGVCVFENGTWHQHGSEDGVVSDYLQSMAIDAQGRIWVGSWAIEGGVSMYDGQHWHTYSCPGGGHINALAADPAGYVWVAANEAVYTFDGQVWVPMAVEDGAPSYADGIAIGPDGDKWLYSWSGARRLRDAVLDPETDATAMELGETLTVPVAFALRPGLERSYTFTISGVPAGVTANLDDADQNQLRVEFHASPEAIPGRYNVTILANSDVDVRSATVSLLVAEELHRLRLPALLR